MILVSFESEKNSLSDERVWPKSLLFKAVFIFFSFLSRDMTSKIQIFCKNFCSRFFLVNKNIGSPKEIIIASLGKKSKSYVLTLHMLDHEKALQLEEPINASTTHSIIIWTVLKKHKVILQAIILTQKSHLSASKNVFIWWVFAWVKNG